MISQRSYISAFFMKVSANDVEYRQFILLLVTAFVYKGVHIESRSWFVTFYFWQFLLRERIKRLQWFHQPQIFTPTIRPWWYFVTVYCSSLCIINKLDEWMQQAWDFLVIRGFWCQWKTQRTSNLRFHTEQIFTCSGLRVIQSCAAFSWIGLHDSFLKFG